MRGLWSAPWIVGPAALVAILALARLARVRPGLQPLVTPFTATVLAIAVMLAAGARELGDGALSLFFLVPALVLVIRASVILLQALFRRSRGEDPPALLDSVISVLLYGVGAGVVAKIWFGVELTPFLATSAVVGAVVGLALQDTLGNLFTGIALHTESPFHVGDWVKLGDFEGKIEQVSWRATRLRTWYGDTLTIPNNEVSRRPILNYSLPKAPHSRTLQIGVSFQTPPNKVLSVLSGVVDQVPGLPRDPAPSLRVVAYHDFAIQYEVRYHVSGYEDYRRVEGEILRLVWYHFRRHGIEIPFPVRNVYLHQAEPLVTSPEAPATRLERTLRGIDLFRPLTEDELRAAAGRFRHLHYAAGERIIQEGDDGNSFFVVDSGEVEVQKTLGGARRSLATLMEGQFFGEMALLTGERRAATVVASTDVDLFTIDKGAFHDVLVANPAIAVEISAILAERREALSQAEGDTTARFEPGTSKVAMKEHFLDRIRSYFGL
jgi:small-conductance mechanosensitive channel/CRP-like cAMP-binding protein